MPEPVPPADALGDTVLRRALEAAGVSLEARPEAVAGAWIRAARREAVDNQPASSGQALSPRSTRGATRA